MGTFDNSLAIGKTLQYLTGPLRLIIEFVGRLEYSEDWEKHTGEIDEMDTRALLGVILEHKDLFHSKFGQRKSTLFPFMNSVHFLIRARNLWAHQGVISNYDSLIILDIAVRFIQEIRSFICLNSSQMNHQPLVERIQIIQGLYNQLLSVHAQNAIKPNSDADHAYTVKLSNVDDTVQQVNGMEDMDVD